MLKISTNFYTFCCDLKSSSQFLVNFDYGSPYFLNILIRSKSLEIASNFVEDIESGLFFPNKSLFFIPSTNFPLTTFKIYRKQPPKAYFVFGTLRSI